MPTQVTKMLLFLLFAGTIVSASFFTNKETEKLKDPVELGADVQVTITDLKSEKGMKLNGKSGKILNRSNDQSRWDVILHKSAQPISFQPKNLKVKRPSSTDSDEESKRPQSHFPKNNCLKNHRLNPFTAPKSGYYCDNCVKSIPEGEPLHGCRRCNFDLCEKCHGSCEDSEKERKFKQGDEVQLIGFHEQNTSYEEVFEMTPNRMFGKLLEFDDVTKKWAVVVETFEIPNLTEAGWKVLVEPKNLQHLKELSSFKTDKDDFINKLNEFQKSWRAYDSHRHVRDACFFLKEITVMLVNEKYRELYLFLTEQKSRVRGKILYDHKSLFMKAILVFLSQKLEANNFHTANFSLKTAKTQGKQKLDALSI